MVDKVSMETPGIISNARNLWAQSRTILKHYERTSMIDIDDVVVDRLIVGQKALVARLDQLETKGITFGTIDIETASLARLVDEVATWSDYVAEKLSDWVEFETLKGI